MTRTTSILSLAAALVLAACGGTSSSPPTVRVTRGAITSTSPGGATVNGVALATASASVRNDGKVVPAEWLAKGMVVTARGSFDDRAGVAESVEAEHAVEGRVDDKGTDFVVVGGLRVNVDGSTEFDASHPARLDSVQLGDAIAVSGVADDRGGVRASRIDDSPRQGGPAEGKDDFDVQGFVSAWAPGTSFELRISPDATERWLVLVSGVALPAGFGNGARVEVHALTPPAAGTLPLLGTITASAVELEDALEAPDAQGELEIEGIVGAGGTAASFFIDGVNVVTDGATRWELGTPADLVPGAKVEAEGRVDAGGVLHASKVSFRAGARISAVIDATDGVSTMTLLGVQVQIPSFARVSLALAAGTAVEVRGTPDAAGTGMVALRVDPYGSGRPIIRAVATAKSNATPSAPSFGVLGFGVTTAGATFRGLSGETLTAEAFYAAVEAGRTVVKARAPNAAAVSGTAFAADELQLEGSE